MPVHRVARSLGTWLMVGGLCVAVCCGDDVQLAALGVAGMAVAALLLTVGNSFLADDVRDLRR